MFFLQFFVKPIDPTLGVTFSKSLQDGTHFLVLLSDGARNLTISRLGEIAEAMGRSPGGLARRLMGSGLEGDEVVTPFPGTLNNQF